MADWVTISSLATAGGTLALAVTTYASVRSANRAARVAELSLRAGLLPLLVESGDSDDTLRVNFYEIHGIAVPGGRAAVEIIDDNVYLVVSLRNVGNGIAVLHGGRVWPGRQGAGADPPPLDSFRLLSRDIYVPAGTIGVVVFFYRPLTTRSVLRLLVPTRAEFADIGALTRSALARMKARG